MVQLTTSYMKGFHDSSMIQQHSNRRHPQVTAESSSSSSKALKDSDIFAKMQQYVKTKYDPHEEEIMNEILHERDALQCIFQEENDRKLQQFMNFMEISSVLSPPPAPVEAAPLPKETRFSCICADNSTVDAENQYIHSTSCKRYREMCEKINNSSVPSRQDHTMMQAIDAFASTQRKRCQNGVLQQKKRQEKQLMFKPSISQISEKLYAEMVRTGRLERKPVQHAQKATTQPKDLTFIPTISKRSQEIINDKRLRTQNGYNATLDLKKSPAKTILRQVSSQLRNQDQLDIPPPPLNIVTMDTTTNCNFILQNFIHSN